MGKKAADETSAASDQTLATLVPTSTAFDCTRKKSGSKKKGLLLFATHWNRDFYFWPLDDAKEQKFVYDVFVRNKNFQWSVWEPKISSIICVRRTLAYVRVEVSEVGSKSVWSNILGAKNWNLKYLKSEKKKMEKNFLIDEEQSWYRAWYLIKIWQK